MRALPFSGLDPIPGNRFRDINAYMRKYSNLLIAQKALRSVPTLRRARHSAPRFQIVSIEPIVNRVPQMTPMRVLLHDSRKMKFIGSGDRWTKDSSKARDFHSGWWATFHAFTMNPRHLTILYQFQDERYDIHIPVVGNAQSG
jgi:hypothetical protein